MSQGLGLSQATGAPTARMGTGGGLIGERLLEDVQRVECARGAGAAAFLGPGHQFLVEALRHNQQFLAELLA